MVTAGALNDPVLVTPPAMDKVSAVPEATLPLLPRPEAPALRLIVEARTVAPFKFTGLPVIESVPTATAWPEMVVALVAVLVRSPDVLKLPSCFNPAAIVPLLVTAAPDKLTSLKAAMVPVLLIALPAIAVILPTV